MTVEGAKANYGVIVDPSTWDLDNVATEKLRADIEQAEAGKERYLSWLLGVKKRPALIHRGRSGRTRYMDLMLHLTT